MHLQIDSHAELGIVSAQRSLREMLVQRVKTKGQRMLKIYIADTAALSKESVFEDYIGRVDEARREKVRQCRNAEDRKRSLLAGYLLQVGVRDWLGGRGGLQADAAPLSLSYTYGENGKPFLKDYDGIFFSLSHSGKYAAGAFSGHAVGIDVQEHRETRYDMADRFFAEEDKALLERLGEGNRDENFYRIWAVKEAYMKLTGEGMRQGFSAAAVEPDGEGLRRGKVRRKNRGTENAYFAVSDILDNYSIAVCSYGKISDIHIDRIEIGQAGRL